MSGKPVSSTRVSSMHRPLPGEANNAGNLHGGNLMRHLDAFASLVAVRFARSRIVTASVNAMFFLGPVPMDVIVHFHGSVNAVWKSSMEVGIRTETEHPVTGVKRHVGTSYLTFVSLDEQGAARALPPLVAENEEDERRMADAERRKAFSSMERKHARPARQAGGHTLEFLPGRYVVCTLPPDIWPELAHLPYPAFLGLSRTTEELSCVLRVEPAASLREKNPAMEVSEEFVCLSLVQAAKGHEGEGLSSLLAALALAGVTAYCTGTKGVLLLAAGDLEPARACLHCAGHSFV